jgi:branched-chain amino acid transport system ATP-binding protein
MLLEVEGLCVNYGQHRGHPRHQLQRRGGQRRHADRANGAGQDDDDEDVSGLRRVREGRVVFDGKDITNVPPYERVTLGLSQSPEGRGIFPGMTVRENLDMGAYARKDKAAMAADLERALTLFPRLQERIAQVAATLSGGEQQMLAIGRRWMARPRLILLDEPSMGLAPMLIQQIFSIIKEINEQGTTVLLVEQNAAQALKAADQAYVLETGEIVRSGTGRSSPATTRSRGRTSAADV